MAHRSPSTSSPRPSAAGDGYDGGASSGSNYGPREQRPDRRDRGAEGGDRRLRGRRRQPSIPADAVTASASGLDPHISPAYALLQVDARRRGARPRRADVRDLVESRIQARDLGFLGEPRVNVLELNLALDALQG